MGAIQIILAKPIGWLEMLSLDPWLGRWDQAMAVKALVERGAIALKAFGAQTAMGTARRQRRFRERRRRGVFVVPAEVTGEMVDALVDHGKVDEANAYDRDCVGKAITAAARRGLDLT